MSTARSVTASAYQGGVRARTKAAPWQDLDLVLAASSYAADAHCADVRKATTIPYLSHLWAVAALALEHGADDEQVAAALLHDVVEDHGGPTRLAEVRRRFGEGVAELVEALSDSVVDTSSGEQKACWCDRKVAYLAHLAEADGRVALVSACDKLHNARAILADLRSTGAEVWDRFNAKDPHLQLWYYEALTETLKPKVPEPLGEELERTVAAIRAEVERPDGEAS